MERISFDNYFMNIAIEIAKRSSDPKTKVGCVIVNESNRIISTGYNGTPSGFNDKIIDWTDRETVRNYIIHAECNAILHIDGHGHDQKKNLKLYCTLSPCKECIKLIKTAGINTIYFKDKYKDFEEVQQICKFFDITINLKEIE